MLKYQGLHHSRVYRRPCVLLLAYEYTHGTPYTGLLQLLHQWCRPMFNQQPRSAHFGWAACVMWLMCDWNWIRRATASTLGISCLPHARCTNFGCRANREEHVIVRDTWRIAEITFKGVKSAVIVQWQWHFLCSPSLVAWSMGLSPTSRPRGVLRTEGTGAEDASDCNETLPRTNHVTNSMRRSPCKLSRHQSRRS